MSLPNIIFNDYPTQELVDTLDVDRYIIIRFTYDDINTLKLDILKQNQAIDALNDIDQFACSYVEMVSNLLIKRLAQCNVKLNHRIIGYIDYINEEASFQARIIDQLCKGRDDIYDIGGINCPPI